MNFTKLNEEKEQLKEIFSAIENNDGEGVLRIVKSGIDINLFSIDLNFMTPLYYATKLGKKEMVSLLISNGADVNFAQPLSIAIFNNDAEIASILLENGANSNAKFSLG